MKIDQCFKVGYILKPHGLKGQVTVSLDPGSPTDLSDVDTVFLEKGNVLVPHFIESVSISGNKAFVKFEDVDDQASANFISKSGLYLPKSARPKSGRGNFYDDEIIGFNVIDEERGELGIVKEVVQAGPNKLLSVGNEILIPLNGPFITAVNKTKKIISVSLPEGFVEINSHDEEE